MNSPFNFKPIIPSFSTDELNLLGSLSPVPIREIYCRYCGTPINNTIAAEVKFELHEGCYKELSNTPDRTSPQREKEEALKWNDGASFEEFGK